MSKDHCPFEHAILTSRFSCNQSRKILIAHKEGIACTHPPARLSCMHLIEHLKRGARFTLQLSDIAQPLPHGKDMKLKCGGLLGLQHLLNPAAGAARGVEDIHALVQQALEHYGHINAIPCEDLLGEIAAYKLRHKRRSR
jgi:hypothetical protein